jgi:hypothetical protein
VESIDRKKYPGLGQFVIVLLNFGKDLLIRHTPASQSLLDFTMIMHRMV